MWGLGNNTFKILTSKEVMTLESWVITWIFLCRIADVHQRHIKGAKANMTKQTQLVASGDDWTFIALWEREAEDHIVKFFYIPNTTF